MAQRLAGKRIAIIVANEFEDIELFFPILRLSEEGARVTVVPMHLGSHPRPYLEGKPVTGRFGSPMPLPVMLPGPRYELGTLERLHIDDTDCLLFPGGYSPDYVRRNQAVLNLVREFDRKGKLIAAVCHGPWVLVSAGVISGKRLTGSVGVRDDVTNAGGEYVDQSAVRDGNIVTGRGPNDLPDFCREIIEALSGGAT